MTKSQTLWKHRAQVFCQVWWRSDPATDARLGFSPIRRHFCGRGRSRLFLASAEFYNPATDTWQAIGSLYTGRANLPMTMSGRNLIVSGGEKQNVRLTSVDLLRRNEMGGVKKSGGGKIAPCSCDGSTAMHLICLMKHLSKWISQLAAGLVQQIFRNHLSLRRERGLTSTSSWKYIWKHWTIPDVTCSVQISSGVSIQRRRWRN